MNSGLLLAILLVWVGVLAQLIPLPSAVLDRLSPSRDVFKQHDELGPAVFSSSRRDEAARTAVVAGGSRRSPLSIAPRNTALQLVFLMVFSLFFVGMVCRLSPGDVQWIVLGTTLLGLLLAVMGMLWRPMVPGFVEGMSDGIAGLATPSIEQASRRSSAVNTFGPFGNRNHFAGWMLMAMPPAICYLYAVLQDRIRGVGLTRNEHRLPFVRTGFGLLVLGSGVVLMSLSVFLTQSRSGIGGLVLLLLLIGGAIAWRPETRHRGIMLGSYTGLVVLLVLLGAAWGDLGPALGRYADVNSTDLGGRFPIWRDAIRIVKDFPMFGTGLNTYERAAAAYYTTREFRPEAAHNDYLELAAEGGVWLGLPVLLLTLMFLREVQRRIRKRSENFVSYWLRVGAIVGLIAIALQEMFEFSLQMPGNTALFVVLCAVAVHRVRPDASRVDTSESSHTCHPSAPNRAEV